MKGSRESGTSVIDGMDPGIDGRVPPEVWRRRMEAEGWNLTEEQWAAVLCPARRIVVYAGPGSGKTTVLTGRVLFLLEAVGLDPKRVLVTTFSRQAADELRRRLAGRLPAKVVREMEIGTLHSRMLRWWIRTTGEVPRILSPAEQREIADRVLLRGAGVTRGEFLRELARIKGSVEMGGCSEPQDHRGEWREAYARELERRGLWDFDDILIRTLERLASPAGIDIPWQAVLVDEAQDLNGVQTALIERLARGAALFLIGDDDQSIYRFRGAEPGYFQRCGRDADAAVFSLSVNHRAHDGLVSCANRLIAYNEDSMRKPVRSLRPGPPPDVILFRDEFRQWRWVIRSAGTDVMNGRSCAILARTNGELAPVWRLMREGGRLPMAPSGSVLPEFLTFHGSKGKEFDTVYILNVVEGRIPYGRAGEGRRGEGRVGVPVSAEELREERRLLYVAITRARNRLVLCVPKWMDGRRMLPSRFLGEAGLAIPEHSGWVGMLKKILPRH